MQRAILPPLAPWPTARERSLAAMSNLRRSARLAACTDRRLRYRSRGARIAQNARDRGPSSIQDTRPTKRLRTERGYETTAAELGETYESYDAGETLLSKRVRSPVVPRATEVPTAKTMTKYDSWVGPNPYNHTGASNIWKIACRIRVWDFREINERPFGKLADPVVRAKFQAAFITANQNLPAPNALAVPTTTTHWSTLEQRELNHIASLSAT
ncbi:hypothetical protein B0H13DRAFT_1923630 [Mycena leptocephala]|nr:hypothetical protein B0H13DRAFT_1923630 [Mycena leptocephala]